MARGSLKKRYKGSWSIILDLGYQVEPQTGKRKRKQRWYTVRGTKREAEARLAELLHQTNHNTLTEPTKLIFGEWLDTWVEVAVKPPVRRLRTYESYKSIIDRHPKPSLGQILLQELDAVHLERYYREKGSTLAQRTLEHHHAVISRSLKSAQKKRLVERNVCQLVENTPKAPIGRLDVIDHCWDEAEAKTFLQATGAFGAQPAALYALGLDSGARKGELCGLRWSNVDLKAGTIRITEQLVKPGRTPVFGPTKNSNMRTIPLATQTVALLRQHRSHQAEIKLRNRAHYRDQGLVFAKEWGEVSNKWDTLGDPLQMNNIGQREFNKIIEAAGIRRIKFHGMRYVRYVAPEGGCSGARGLRAVGAQEGGHHDEHLCPRLAFDAGRGGRQAWCCSVQLKCFSRSSSVKPRQLTTDSLSIFAQSAWSASFLNLR